MKRTEKNKLKVIAITNILVASINKILLLLQGAFGAPLILTIILWIFIFKQKKWAYYVYSILCLLISFLGILSVILFFANIYYGHSPINSLLGIILSISYAISWFCIKKIII